VSLTPFIFEGILIFFLCGRPGPLGPGDCNFGPTFFPPGASFFVSASQSGSRALVGHVPPLFPVLFVTAPTIALRPEFLPSTGCADSFCSDCQGCLTHLVLYCLFDNVLLFARDFSPARVHLPFLRCGLDVPVLVCHPFLRSVFRPCRLPSGQLQLALHPCDLVIFSCPWFSTRTRGVSHCSLFSISQWLMGLAVSIDSPPFGMGCVFGFFHSLVPPFPSPGNRYRFFQDLRTHGFRCLIPLFLQ